MKNNMMKCTSNCGLRQRTKKASFLIVSLALVCALLCGCSSLQGYRPVTDIHALDGRRIGVGLACGPDYILSRRDDLTVMRYNLVSGAITALRYRQVDAVAVEKPTAIDIANSVSGLQYIEEPIAWDSIGFILGIEHEELKEEINAFIAEFIKTPEYEDMVARSNDPNGYTFKQVPLKGGDRVLQIGAVSDAYPFSYPNFTTGSYEGTDVEFLCHFANAYGYDLVFHDGTWDSMELGVQYGQYDIGCGGVSESYRPDIELSGGVLMTDTFLPVEIVLVINKDQNQ